MGMGGVGRSGNMQQMQQVESNEPKGETEADDAVAAQKQKKTAAKDKLKEAKKKEPVKVKDVQQTQEETQKTDEQEKLIGKNKQKTRVDVDEGKQQGGQKLLPESTIKDAAKTIGEIDGALGKLDTDLSDISDLMKTLTDNDLVSDDMLAATSSSEKATKKQNEDQVRRKRIRDLIARYMQMAQASAETGQGNDQRDRTVDTTLQSQKAQTLPIDPNVSQQQGRPVSLNAMIQKAEGGDYGNLVEQLQERAAILLEIHAELEDLEVDPSQQETKDALCNNLTKHVDDLGSGASHIVDKHNSFKNLFKAMLSGEFGALRLNPYDQFKSLFTKVKRWPATIPPGFNCSDKGKWGTENWDKFFQWLKKPPVPPLGLKFDMDTLKDISNIVNQQSGQWRSNINR